jgi:hypothetical protein
MIHCQLNHKVAGIPNRSYRQFRLWSKVRDAPGFLSLDTEEIPGNAGMADQVEALRWVQKFIKYFGGDKDKVTIVGESAGAASVGFLLLAPQSKEEG